jgi:zinc protease
MTGGDGIGSRRDAASDRPAGALLRRRTVLATGATLASAPALGQSGSETTRIAPPPPGPPRPLVIEPPREGRLDNGLGVVVATRPGVPLVTALLVVREGAERDPAGRAGLAGLTASLMARGTRRRSAPALAAAAEALGSSLDAGASWGESTLGMTVVVPLLGEALALMGEVVREPAFAAAELARLREETIDSQRVALAAPAALATLAATRAAFAGRPGALPASGTPDTLATIERAAIVAQHRDLWRPERAVLVLAGDLSHEAGMAAAARHLGTWKAAGEGRAAPATATPAPPPSEAATSAAPTWTSLVDAGETGQAAVAVAVRVPRPRGIAEHAVADVVDALLGGGYSARLNQEVRVRRGLSYDATSRLVRRGDDAVLIALSQTKDESAVEVARIVQAIFDGLAADSPGEAELAARRATLIGGFGRSVETTAGLAAQVRACIVEGRPVASLATHVETLLAVPADDVRRYAAAHLGRGSRQLGIAGALDRIAAEALGTPTRRVTRAELGLGGAR